MDAASSPLPRDTAWRRAVRRSAAFAGIMTLAIIAGARAGAEARRNPTAVKIAMLEQDSCKALLDKNWAALDRLMDRDFANVDMRGAEISRAQGFANYPSYKVGLCEIDQLSVRVHGSTAVAVGRMRLRSAHFDGAFRFTDTFVRRSDRWALLASQQTELR